MPRVAVVRQAKLMNMRWFLRGLGPVLGLLGLLAGSVGCGPRAIRGDLEHHNISDEDLLALLPQGQEAVVDIDVAALRSWPPSRSLLDLLPGSARAKLGELVADPLADIDSVGLGFQGLGTSGVEATLLVRGRLHSSKLWQSMQARSASREVTYHGMAIVEDSTQAVARLTEQTLVVGSRLQVRQIIDIFRGVDHGVRKQSLLMTALAMAPSGKSGRPPILAAVLLSADLHHRLHDAGMLRVLDEAQAVALAMAVGDGFDIGVVASYPMLAIAGDAVAQIKAQAAELAGRPLAKLLSLDRFVMPLVAVAVPKSSKRPTPELHLAYRLPGDDLTDLLRRLSELKRALPASPPDAVPTTGAPTDSATPPGDRTLQRK